MLHAMIQDHRTLCSREETFEVLHHIREWSPSWSCDRDYFFIDLGPVFSRMLHLKFGFDLPSGFREEDG